MSVVRDQLVGLMDNMKTGGIMTGHSWLQEPADADSGDTQVRLLTIVTHSGDISKMLILRLHLVTNR